MNGLANVLCRAGTSRATARLAKLEQRGERTSRGVEDDVRRILTAP